MSNPLSPELMTAAERIAEIAETLAVGVLRLRRRQSASKSSQLEKLPLDFSPDRSMHATVRKGRRVAR